MIPLFDGHCDTLLLLEHMKLPAGSLRKNNLHIDLERYGQFGPAAQFFAIFGMAPKGSDYDILNSLHSRFVAELEANSELMSHCTTAAQAEKAAAEGKLAAFLSVEGAHIIDEGDRLEEAYEKGVRMLTLTWNNATGIAGTNVEEPERGLSAKGEELVRRCESMGIIVDMSHLSERGFWDTVEMCAKPVIASHSCSKAICGHSRNLTDDQFKALRDVGGVVGLNLYAAFLGDEELDTCIRHVEHFLELGGEKTLAAGGDLDGCDKLPKPMTGIDGWAVLYNALRDRGYSEALLADIFYNNMMRVVRNVCDM